MEMGLEGAKQLLEMITESMPPGKGQRHNLTLNGDKLELNLMFGKKIQPVLVTGNSLMIPVKLVFEEIKGLVGPIISE